MNISDSRKPTFTKTIVATLAASAAARVAAGRSLAQSAPAPAPSVPKTPCEASPTAPMYCITPGRVGVQVCSTTNPLSNYYCPKDVETFFDLANPCYNGTSPSRVGLTAIPMGQKTVCDAPFYYDSVNQYCCDDVGCGNSAMHPHNVTANTIGDAICEGLMQNKQDGCPSPLDVKLIIKRAAPQGVDLTPVLAAVDAE